MTHVPLTMRFASWGMGLDPNDFPADVHVVARRAILDTLGVMVAGGTNPRVRALAASLRHGTGPCSSLCIEHGSAETAALINGMAAHVWGFEDTSYTGIMHGSSVVLPVVLALAEEQGADEEDLIAAFIAGSEVAYTLGDICTHDHYFQGWFSTATFGLVGATAAAARLLGLTTDQAAHAIGGAAASASGGRGVLGTEMKPYLVGEAARRAIGFARAAQTGLTGPADAFESPGGFFALLNKGLAEEAEAATIGQRWRLTNPGLLFKTSPVCSAAHAAIEQMVLLMDELSATADDIVSIMAEIPELVGISLIHPNPNTPQEAQFSLPYALACAAVHGRVRMADLQPEMLMTGRMAAIMKKVTFDVAEDLSTEEMRKRYPESARLTVTLADGRVMSGFCGEAYGMPRRPLSDEDLTKKFKECLQYAEACVPEISLMETNLLHLSAEILR